MNKIRRFRTGTKGATAIEYGLLAAVIALGMIVGASGLGTTVGAQYDALGNCVSDPSSANINC